jgi:predicted nuclease of predicted toxin-antitoxin system
MRFLVDAQLAPALCGWFGERGYDAEHVGRRLGGQTPDAAIAALAAAEGSVLVTKDDDFALRHPPTDYQLVWIRCGNVANRALREWPFDRWPMLLEKLEAGEPLVEVR